jgi:ribosome-associated toxin RatA of RatAB toxin-antitoxin module
MPERTSSTISIAASAAQIMAVIADLGSYPEWTGSVRSVEVLTVYDDADERPARATFVLDAGAIKDTYTLEYTWRDDSEVTWTMLEAGMLTAMDGAYRLTAAPDGVTEVEYELTLELKIPMIGLLRRKAEKVVTDTALKELKKRVEG